MKSIKLFIICMIIFTNFTVTACDQAINSHAHTILTANFEYKNKAKSTVSYLDNDFKKKYCPAFPLEDIIHHKVKYAGCKQPSYLKNNNLIPKTNSSQRYTSLIRTVECDKHLTIDPRSSDTVVVPFVRESHKSVKLDTIALVIQREYAIARTDNKITDYEETLKSYGFKILNINNELPRHGKQRQMPQPNYGQNISSSKKPVSSSLLKHEHTSSDTSYATNIHPLAKYYKQEQTNPRQTSRPRNTTQTDSNQNRSITSHEFSSNQDPLLKKELKSVEHPLLYNTFTYTPPTQQDGTKNPLGPIGSPRISLNFKGEIIKTFPAHRQEN